mmetsp:Transcript_114520/g.220578  ORF Transcript_114520/g.220578 Transcript_114520/m.220578 type:complete len:471 (+) Transcript_114520:256-1668(+)
MGISGFTFWHPCWSLLSLTCWRIDALSFSLSGCPSSALTSAWFTLVALLSIPRREASNFNGLFKDTCAHGIVKISTSANIVTVMRSKWPSGAKRTTGTIWGSTIQLLDVTGVLSDEGIAWSNGCMWTREAFVASSPAPSSNHCNISGPIFLRGSNSKEACAGYRRTCVQGSGSTSRIVNTSERIVVPTCLAPPGFCLTRHHVVQRSRPESRDFWQFQGRSIYQVPKGGELDLMVTLPLLTTDELWELYSVSDFHPQRNLTHMWRRAAEQALMIENYIRTFNMQLKLNIVEMGCGAGYLLRQLRVWALDGGQLTCFETDPAILSSLSRQFEEARREYPRLRIKLVPEMMDWNQLEDSSVDLFMSSHALEHVPDLCVFLEGVMRVLKPGGLVFTEVPLQQHEVRSRYFNGEFHLSFFSGHSFQRMMERNGFESVYLDSSEGDKGLRTLFRKPAAGDPQAIGVFCGGGSAAAA